MIKNQKIIIFIFFLTIFCLFPFFQTHAQNIDLYFFWGSGCPHCANMASVLQEINASYSTLKINTFEVWYNPNNQRLLNAVADGYNFKPSGVPVIFVGDQVIEGDSQTAINRLKEAIRQCSVNECISPKDKIKTSKNKIILKWDNIGILAGIIIFIFLIISLLKKKK